MDPSRLQRVVLTKNAALLPEAEKTLQKARADFAQFEKGLQERVHAILDQYAFEYTLKWTLHGRPFLTPRGRLVRRHAIEPPGFRRVVIQLERLDPYLTALMLGAMFRVAAACRGECARSARAGRA